MPPITSVRASSFAASQASTRASTLAGDDCPVASGDATSLPGILKTNESSDVAPAGKPVHRVHFAPNTLPDKVRPNRAPSRPAYDAAHAEELYFRTRNLAINLASYALLGAALSSLGRYHGPLPMLATLVGCGAVATSWQRTHNNSNALLGFDKLAAFDNAGAERAFSYACTRNNGRLGLAEARRRQGKWAEAAYALWRLDDPDNHHVKVVEAQLLAIALHDSTPMQACHCWM